MTLPGLPGDQQPIPVGFAPCCLPREPGDGRFKAKTGRGWKCGCGCTHMSHAYVHTTGSDTVVDLKKHKTRSAGLWPVGHFETNQCWLHNFGLLNVERTSASTPWFGTCVTWQLESIELLNMVSHPQLLRSRRWDSHFFHKKAPSSRKPFPYTFRGGIVLYFGVSREMSLSFFVKGILAVAMALEQQYICLEPINIVQT